VTTVTVFEDEAGLPLEFPEEPVALRDGLRDALLGGQDWTEDLPEELSFELWLWERWQPVLEPAGLGFDRFAVELVDNRRELWLWLLGERQWSQVIEAQAGRILRRLPTA
jgi:hypothetical protein